MPSLQCPLTNCDEQVENADRELADALLNAHIATHTMDTRRSQGSGPDKSEKLTRPKITQGILMESWNSFLARWKLYKTGTGLSEAECGLQLIYCCDEDLLKQTLRADPNLVTKPEAEQLEAIRKLAVIPIAMGMRRSETLNMVQESGEPSRAFLAKVQGKAATCQFRTKCAEDCCREKGNPVDFTNTIVKYVLVNGLVDAEIRREVLGWELLDESTLTDAIAFIEQKEMARDAFKGEAAAIKTGYRKQQASTGTADEAKLRKKAKCEGCATPFNQYVRGKSGQIREHKLCKKCWRATSQKREMTEPRAKPSGDETVKTEEASTLFVSGNWSIPYQGMGAIKHRSKHSKRTQNDNLGVPGSSSNETSVVQQRGEVAMALHHHAGDPTSGGAGERVRQQPTLQLSVRPCQDAYSRLNIHAPKVAPVTVDGIADTGAQACLWSATDFYGSGYEEQDLVKVKQQVAAVNGQVIGILGAIFLAAEANSVKTTLTVFVTPEIRGLYLSRQALLALYVIPQSFPTAGDAKNRAGKEEGTLRTKERIPIMVAEPTFKHPRQLFAAMEAHPQTRHAEKNAKPVVHRTPCTLPTQWRDKVKPGWKAATAKPDKEPRTSVNVSPLSKLGGKERHDLIPPPIQAGQARAHTRETATDTCSHSTPTREEDKQPTTLNTERERHRHRVAPRGHAPSNEDHPKRYDRTIESAGWKARVAGETTRQDADHDPEAHRQGAHNRPVSTGRQGSTPNEGRPQPRNKSAGFRMSAQEATTLQRLLESTAAPPAQENAREAGPGYDLVGQTVDYEQTRSRMAPPDTRPPLVMQAIQTRRPRELFEEPQRGMSVMVKCGTETGNLARPRPDRYHTKEDFGSYPAQTQKHRECTKIAQPCRERGRKAMPTSSRLLQAAEAVYAWLEGKRPNVTRPVKQTKPPRETLSNKALEYTFNTDPPCSRKNTLPGNLATRHRPVGGKHAAVYKTQATPRNRTHPPMSNTVNPETTPIDKEDTQGVRSQTASGTTENGPKLRTEVEGLGQHTDRPSMADDVRPCDGATATPAKLRQTAVNTPGGTQRNTQVTRDEATGTTLRPGTNRNVLVHAAPDQASIQPHPGTKTGARWSNAPTRHPVESNLGGTRPHGTRAPRDNVGTSVGAKTSRTAPYEAARPHDPLRATRNKGIERSQTDKAPFGRGARAMTKRDRKRRWVDIPATRVTSSGLSQRQDSAWGARGGNHWSADPNGPGGGPTEDGKGTRETGPLGNQGADHGMQERATRFEVLQGSQLEAQACSALKGGRQNHGPLPQLT